MAHIRWRLRRRRDFVFAFTITMRCQTCMASPVDTARYQGFRNIQAAMRSVIERLIREGSQEASDDDI